MLIDMNNGNIVWQIPLGEYPELIQKGIPLTGSTEPGRCNSYCEVDCSMIGATRDEKIPDIRQAKWQTAVGVQTAGRWLCHLATYTVNGQQYIVIAA